MFWKISSKRCPERSFSQSSLYKKEGKIKEGEGQKDAIKMPGDDDETVARILRENCICICICKESQDKKMQKKCPVMTMRELHVF